MSPLLDTARTVLIDVAPGMPPSCWAVTAAALALLAAAAAIDAVTAIIPDILIIAGLLTVIGAQGLFTSWGVAAHHFLHALAAGLLIWGVNAAWYRAFRHDALGMGDAKWTMLAVACFGVAPALFAWGLGSILAILFIGAARLARRKVGRTPFAPFLFIGLCGGLGWTYASGLNGFF